MRDLTDARLIYAKGILFLICGVLAGGLLIAEHFTLRNTALLSITVWCFCRSYYFAFYVIQHYLDDRYRYAGLWSFARYAIGQRLGWKQAERR